MKARLMHPDHDFDLGQDRPRAEVELTQDLELDTLVGAMAVGDEVIDAVVRTALVCSPPDLGTIRYRQEVLRDCLRTPELAVEMYGAATDAIRNERRIFSPVFARSPESQLSRAVKVLSLLLGTLQTLRSIADANAPRVSSEGLQNLFAMLGEELTDDYLATIRDHLARLQFPQGVLISAGLGRGNTGSGYALRKPPDRGQNLLTRLTTRNPPHYTVTVADRDVAGAQVLRELRDRGVALVSAATSQAAGHVLDFLSMLRTELAFYVGCLNLHARLRAKHLPVCFPEAFPAHERVLNGTGLYDVSLALSVEGPVVGNNLHADGKDLVMITGANQGGKSTFLRSLGLARLMMQSGMYVGAGALQANTCRGLFTHYKREEDVTLKSGKLDEELARMSDIADQLEAHSLVLCNESFASTNEREGSEIAAQVVRALVDRQVQVAFVTHFYELAHGFYQEHQDDVLFLRAERRAGGERTFRMVEGPPEETSYGVDLYRQVFTERPVTAPAPGDTS